MKKSLTVWQASVLLGLCILSTKFQRLSALMAQDFERDIAIMFAIMLLFDFLVGLVFINVISKFKDKTFFEVIKERFGVSARFFVGLLLAIYFLGKLVITYKGSHEFFANVLFDKLSWTAFSVLLVILLLIMVIGGLNVIARTGELYFFLIAISLVCVIGLGLIRAEFNSLLPILHTNVSSKFASTISFQAWMGDYLILLFFMGNIKITQNSTLKKHLIWSYAISVVVNIVGVAVFYAVNEHLSAYQPNALSALTQYSLVTLGIGRPDWFLVLFVFISKLISCAFYLYAISECIINMFSIKNKLWVKVGAGILIYVLDAFILINIETTIDILKTYCAYYMFAVSMLMLILIAVIGYLNKTHNASELENNKGQYKKAGYKV